MSPQLETHCDMVLRSLVRGRVVPLLGAGVNRVGRPEGATWHNGAEYLPDGAELAHFLADYAEYPEAAPADLVRVSQYYSVMLGGGSLYEELRDVFMKEYEPTPIHRFLARMPRSTSSRSTARSCPAWRPARTTR